MRTWRRSVVVLLVLGVAAVALAHTVSELESRGDGLGTTYESLLSAADACPGGTCSARATIESAASAADADLVQLHADRQTLEPCTNCTQLDATILEIDQDANELAGIIEGWGEQG